MPITPEIWSQARLERSFAQLVRLADPSLKLCFFIDGLDEYDGDHGDIAEYIEELTKISPHAKVCVSSRPLPVIQQVFEGSCGLKLQDLTADDIKRYVGDKLEGDRNMQRLISRDPKHGNLLISEIVDKASGVFLWVTLVVKSLIRGLRNGDEISHLLQHLTHLPPDIEHLFEHILERIEPEHKEESSKMFQIFRASGNKLNILGLYRTLRFNDHSGAIDLVTEEEASFSSQTYKDEIGYQAERTTRRLDSRCRGLLEVFDSSGGEVDEVFLGEGFQKSEFPDFHQYPCVELKGSVLVNTPSLTKISSHPQRAYGNLPRFLEEDEMDTLPQDAEITEYPDFQQTPFQTLASNPAELRHSLSTSQKRNFALATPGELSTKADERQTKRMYRRHISSACSKNNNTSYCQLAKLTF